MAMKEVNGIEVKQMSKTSPIKRIKDPIPFPKVQCAYEGESQVIFSTQMSNMLMDITKEMVKIFKK